MEESSPRGTGPNANEEAALPGVPKLSPSSAPLTSLNARGVGTWPGWYESSSAASKSLDPSGQTKDTFEAQAGASTSYRPLYDSSATPLAPSSSHTLSLLGQSFESPRPVHTGALSSSLSPRQPLSYPKTVFSSRSQSGLSSYAEDVSSRSASGLAHETEFSSRAGIKPKGTEFSVRSPPPVPTFAMGGSTTDSLVVRDAKGLELQRDQWAKTWQQAYVELDELQQKGTRGIFAEDSEVQQLNHHLNSLQEGLMEAFRIFSSSSYVSDSERTAWEAEKNVWAQAQVELSQRLELEAADAAKVRRDLIVLQERLTAGHSDQSAQSGLIKELEKKLQDAVAQIKQHQDAHRLSRQEMAQMLDCLMAEKQRTEQKVADLESALKIASSMGGKKSPDDSTSKVERAVFEEEKARFCEARKALVVRLDAEIEGKLGLQRQLSALENKVRHLESALQVHSAPRECQPHNVESSVGVKVADFEEERKMFDEARKALVARLDAEIEGKLGLQRQLSALENKVRHLESALQVHSAPRECQPHNVESSVGVKVADFEEERRMFDEARKALVARLDAEIEGKLGLQRQLSALENKVRHLESALQVHSAPRECQPHNVESSVGVKVADFEEERKMFDEARKALVARLDAEIEGKLGLQRQLSALENKVRLLESALQAHSAPRECQPHNVESSVGVKVADFEKERRMFDEARKVLVGRLDEEVAMRLMLQKQLAAAEAKAKDTGSILSPQADITAKGSVTDSNGKGEMMRVTQTETCSELRKRLMERIDKEVAEKADLQKKLHALLPRSVQAETMRSIPKQITTDAGASKDSAQDQIALLQELLTNQALGFEATRKVLVHKLDKGWAVQSAMKDRLQKLQETLSAYELRLATAAGNDMPSKPCQDMDLESERRAWEEARNALILQNDKLSLRDREREIEIKKLRDELAATPETTLNKTSDADNEIRELKQSNNQLDNSVQVLRRQVENLERDYTTKCEESLRMQAVDKEVRVQVSNLRQQIEAMKKEHQTVLHNLERQHRQELEAAQSDDRALKLKLVREQVREDTERLRQDVRHWTSKASLAEDNLHAARHELGLCNQEFRSSLASLRNAITESSKEVDHVEIEKQVLTRQLVDLQDKYDKAISSLEHCRLEMSHERIMPASGKLIEKDSDKKTLLLEELTAKVRKKDEDMKALHEVLAGKDMALSSLREAVSKSERTAAAKDEEIKSLNVLERSRQNELESAGLERDRLRKERDTLNTRLQQAEAECHRLEQELRGLKNGDEQAKSLKREADRLNAALTSMQEDINQIKKEKSELQMMLQSKKFELAREQQEKAVLATAKSELQTALKNTKYEAEKRAHNHGQEFERIVQERADLWAELQDALETAKACQAQADDWSKRFASASTDLSTQDKQKTLLLEELTAKVRKKDEDMKALHEVLADKDMALSSLREAVSKSERTAAAKDEEIKSLKVLERSRQNELESAGLERDRLRKERDTLNTRLQQAEAECHRLEQELQGEITMHQLREEQLAIELKEAKDLYVIIDREVGATKDEVEKFKASAMSQAKAVMTRVTAESRSRLDDAAEQDAFLRDQLSLQDKKLANQDQQLARQAKELKALEDEARLMKTKLEMRDMELRELEDALESSRRSEQDNALWSEAASELANLQEVITELRQSESMQEEELKQAQAETRNAARAAKEKEVELNQLRRMLDSMRSELQISRDKILLEAEIVDRVEAEAKVKLDEAASELKRLNETLEDKNQEIKKYRYQLVTLGKAHAQKKEDYADLVALHEELEEESSYTKQKLQNATSEVERLREELAQRGSRWNRLEQDRSKSAGAHEEKDAHSGVTFDDDLLFGVLDTSDSAPPTGAKNALTDALRPTLRSA